LSLASTNGAGVIAEVAVALNGCGVAVRSLTLRTPTLDDVFLNVTGAHLAESHDATPKRADDDMEGAA
jgi:ABC-2 type transport system ATP-binding protein